MVTPIRERNLTQQHRPHLILIGGFLGAGKTAAMLALARWLPEQGIRALFVTNDQGNDLVDTRLLRSCGLTTEEIPGGCFCCRFDELAGVTRRRGVEPPEIIVAEAVGSCTDLAATVAYPMRRIMGEQCTVAPLSVVIDPVRARRELGLDRDDDFSESVRYIYHKQLEEADLIVIAKCELLTGAELEELELTIARKFPAAERLVVSSHRGIGTEAWFRRIVFDEQLPRAVIPMDYDRYADGESRLGWLNASVTVSRAEAADGDALLARIAVALHRELDDRAVTVAHLKMTLESGGELASIHLVRNDLVPEPGVRLSRPIASGVLTVNLRAEAAPETLEAALRATLESLAPWRVELSQLQVFRPGRPEPTHRDDGS